VRVGANHLRMHERRLALAPHVGRGFAERAIALHEVGAVAAHHLQVRERFDEARDVAAGRLHFHRDRDRVAIVFDEVQDRHRARARGVQRFPELALAGRAFADREISDLVGMEPLAAIVDRGDALVDHAGLAGADRVKALRAGRAALRRDVEFLVSPMRRHLAAARIRIVLRADGGEEHLVRRHAERQAQRAIAIVGIEPVVARPQVHAGRGQHRFVPGAADLEEDQALVLELYFFVVEAPRQEHRAIRPQQIVPREAFPTSARAGGGCRASVGPGCERRSLHLGKIIPFGWML
jgi:hypothetical protein